MRAVAEPVYDVVIVGGGIVGAACAAEAAAAGLKTAIVEASLIGGGATAAGMGQVVVMDDSEAQFALTRYSQVLWEQLAPQLPADIEYTTCGTFWVAVDDEEMAEVQRKAQYYTERGVPVEVLDATAVESAEPNLRKGLTGALFVKSDVVLYPPRAANWLVEQAQAHGAVLYLGHAAIAIGDTGATLDDGTCIRAQETVNALGCWSPLLTPGLDIQKRKGHLVITDRYPNFIHHQLVELGYLKSAHAVSGDSVAFNLQPRRTGQILIGSSRQYGVDHTQAEPQMVRQMLTRAFEYVPSLASLSAIRTWTGFRASTPDKLPLIGLCSGYQHLYLATGHEGLGITTSLGTAKILFDQILQRPSAIPAEPYLPTRSQVADHA